MASFTKTITITNPSLIYPSTKSKYYTTRSRKLWLENIFHDIITTKDYQKTELRFVNVERNICVHIGFENYENQGPPRLETFEEIENRILEKKKKREEESNWRLYEKNFPPLAYETKSNPKSDQYPKKENDSGFFIEIHLNNSENVMNKGVIFNR